VAQRSFVIRVSESSPRVIVEDVRTREKVVAESFEQVGEAIERWLQGDREAVEAREEEVDA
jgi:hypothetical protein